MKKNAMVKAVKDVKAVCEVLEAVKGVKPLFCEVSTKIVHSCKPCACAGCGEALPNGTECVNVKTVRQPLYGSNYCMKCWNTIGGLTAVSRVRKKAHEDTKWNITDNHNFKVCITHNSDEVKGYCLENGWRVFGKKDCEYYPMRATFEDDSHHAITKYLDSIFTSGYPVTVTVNGQIVKTTEDCRNVLEMKVRNARLNKSLDKKLNVNI